MQENYMSNGGENRWKKALCFGLQDYLVQERQQ